MAVAILILLVLLLLGFSLMREILWHEERTEWSEERQRWQGTIGQLLDERIQDEDLAG